MNEAPIRLLIVDDNAQTRDNIRKLLQVDAGILVVGGAGTGVEAVKIYEELRPDVVTMDTHMPDMDGVTATRAIYSSHKDAKVLMLTVHENPEYMRLAFEAGAKDYIIVPPAPDHLIAAIQRVASAP